MALPIAFVSLKSTLPVEIKIGLEKDFKTPVPLARAIATMHEGIYFEIESLRGSLQSICIIAIASGNCNMSLNIILAPGMDPLKELNGGTRRAPSN